MSAFILLVAIAAQLGAVMSLREQNALTQHTLKRVRGLALFGISVVILSTEFGALAGTILAIALMSLVGILYPLIKWQRA